MSNLHEIFLKNSKNVIDKWIHYLEIYERHFEKYVGKEVLILEIGVSLGGSIHMWREYFGDKAIIVGIDIEPSCKRFEDPDNRVFVEIGDQSDTAFLDMVLERYGRPDVVIDDGSHVMRHLVASFGHLYPKMAETGTYLAEDLHTCYWPGFFEGGLKQEGSFMELVKDKLDEINAVHSKGQLSEDFARQTQSICAYDSVVVFEKKPQGRRFHIQTGGMRELDSLVIGDFRPGSFNINGYTQNFGTPV